MLWPFLAVFKLLSTLFRYLIFFLRQLFLILAPAVLGRRDGSICALRKRRSRNETDNFIKSISQMVPRGPQMVPKGPRWSPEVPRWSPEVPRWYPFDLIEYKPTSTYSIFKFVVDKLLGDSRLCSRKLQTKHVS